MNYQQHPLSAAFPQMSSDEFQNLKDSIEVNGVLNAITIYEDMVIDGWHRYKAANELGVDCPETELDEWIDPKDFVLAQNKNRRHITAAQLAMATTAVYAWVSRGRQNKSAGTADLNKTSAELAKISGTSERTINQAKAVLRDASPEVQEAVKSGKIGLEKAQKISKLPKEKQDGAIDKSLTNLDFERPPFTEDFGPDEAELHASELAQQADLVTFNKLLEADDNLAAAYAETKRLNHLVGQLQIRISVLMREKNAAIDIIKKFQAKEKRQMDLNRKAHMSS